MKRAIILLVLSLLIGSFAFSAKTTKTKKQISTKTTNSNVKFKSCKEARKAGYRNMKKGEPGYSKNLDRDNDGIACDK